MEGASIFARHTWRPSPLVSVIVPAFNAVATLDETLASVCAQTYREIEIIVVDDGSTDRTAAIATAHARIDHRIRVVRQANAGVAAARNRGLAEARGEFIAAIDSDDLWRPEKIERQMAVMASGGERMGLVYTWYALIDEQGRILSLNHNPLDAGDIFLKMCRRNLIGNGSSALIRKAALEEIDGYDTALRMQHAQGCEDFKAYLQIAERWEFGVVPEHLTGYRRAQTNMSSDGLQMLRSRDLVTQQFCARRPELRAAFAEGRRNLLQWLFTRSLVSGRLILAAQLAWQMLLHDPLQGTKSVVKAPITIMRAMLGPRIKWVAWGLFRRGRNQGSRYFLAKPQHTGNAGAVTRLAENCLP